MKTNLTRKGVDFLNAMNIMYNVRNEDVKIIQPQLPTLNRLNGRYLSQTIYRYEEEQVYESVH
jgi:hypothetical protein